MSSTHKVISVRVTLDDFSLHKQAAAQQGQPVSVWIRQNLRENSLKQVFGKSKECDFPSTPGEIALMRAVLVILQSVGVDIPEETKRLFAEKAARQIEKIKTGE